MNYTLNAMEAFNWNAFNSSFVASPEAEERVQFREIFIHYREEPSLVVKGGNCSSKPDEKVGIVGRTGAGERAGTGAKRRHLQHEARREGIVARNGAGK